MALDFDVRHVATTADTFFLPCGTKCILCNLDGRGALVVVVMLFFGRAMSTGFRVVAYKPQVTGLIPVLQGGRL